MKKRLFSILLALCLMLTLLPATALAGEGTTNYLWQVDGTVYSATTEPEDTAAAGSVSLDMSSALDSGSYKLAGDITISSSILVSDSSEVTLDLNGYVLCYYNSEGAYGSVIQVKNGGKLTLQDSSTATDAAAAAPEYNFSVDETTGLWSLCTDEDCEHTTHKTVTGGIITGGTGTVNNKTVGGGVYVYDSGSFTMAGGTIVGCTGDTGGGVHVHHGSFTMQGGAIVGCVATSAGGGVSVGGSADNKGNFTMSGGIISDCEVRTRDSRIIGSGGGVSVYENGTFTMSGDAVIQDCEAKNGGGVYNASGSFTMTGDAVIQDCEAKNGGGVCNTGGNFTMSGGTIRDCTATEDGGGMYIEGTTAQVIQVTMSGGTVEDCTAINGGGLYTMRCAFTMTAGTISGCKAQTTQENVESNGGGVCMGSMFDAFTMSGGTIKDCTANGKGGGVYTTSGTSTRTFTMSNGAIKGCTANGDGGAVYINNQKYMYANGGTIEGDVYILKEQQKRGGTITRTVQSEENDANLATYTKFSGTVSGNGTIKDVAKLTVTFQDEEGHAITDADGQPITKKTLRGQKVEKPDYSVPGHTVTWKKGGTEWDFDSDIVDQVDLVLTASMTAHTYDITLDANGGTFTAGEDMTSYTYGKEETLPTPTRSGYDFDGWYDNENFEGDPIEKIPADSIGAKNYYAKWTLKTYTVTFDSAGGSAVASQTVSHGETATQPDAPTRGGYRFTGWYTGDEAYDFAAPVTGGLTLTAHWTQLPAASKPLYDVIVKDAPNGEADSNRDEARPGTIVTITVAPDSGYTLDDITVTDKDGNELEVNDLGGGKYSFIMPDSDVTVRPGFTDGSGTGFVDVPADKYYYDAVNWAVANGITGGIDGTHFAPDAPCTRGQMVTLLWRALGKPEAKTVVDPFTDVKEASAFYQAILWASENDIVVGYADGTFRPNDPVTRQQSAAILWRYAKYAGMDVSVGEDTNILSFDDALDIAEYAFPALQWAVGEGIMQGSHGNLLPRSTCTRAQIVTMLYRLLTE